MFACLLSQMEPKKPVQALKEPSLVEAMQDELLQFKLLKVWTLVDLPRDKWAIGTKWVFRNKKDERGIVVKNKARLVAQGHTQEEGIDYDEVFAPVARIKAIRLFLAYDSFKDFVVYQMDVKSAFLYGKIEEEVYVCQPPSFEDPDFPNKVYKVEKAIYGLHQALRAWYETLLTYMMDNGFTGKELSPEFEKLMHDKFQMSSMGELSFFLGLQVQQKSDGIFLSQDKYVAEILKKFEFVNVKTASTPIEPNKALIKDEEAEDVDVHLYRSMIGSLMYLTTSRPDITFVVYACARDSPFDLEAFSDSDYAGASLDRKSTTGDCQFLRKRLISWQCKKQTIVANSTTEAEYIAAFWQTASASTLKDGEVGITATIDGQLKTVTEASLRRHLKLEDADGISSLPNTEIFEQLALMGYVSNTDSFNGNTGVDVPYVQTMIVQGLILQGEGSTVPETEVPQPSSPSQTHNADEAASIRVDVRLGWAATTVSSLDAR
ncbi:putative ribonuclease H-like domain-containing protein [Tanacetum coccineum]